LKRHIANAVLRVDSRGQRIAKETKYSTRRIDLAISAVMALDRAAAPDPNDYDLMASVL
jgi:phage terminase large subunit-like protein